MHLELLQSLLHHLLQSRCSLGLYVLLRQRLLSFCLAESRYLAAEGCYFLLYGFILLDVLEWVDVETMLKVDFALKVEESPRGFAETYAGLLLLQDFVLSWAKGKACVFAESLWSGERYSCLCFLSGLRIRTRTRIVLGPSSCDEFYELKRGHELRVDCVHYLMSLLAAFLDLLHHM